MKILIVDDDFTSREVLCHFLGDIGDKDFACNGFEAIQKVLNSIKKNQPYDIILQDIMMPHLDGIQVVKVIRAIETIAKSGFNAKVIMTTGKDDDKTIINAFSAGADGYMTKPIIKEKLFDNITKLFEKGYA